MAKSFVDNIRNGTIEKRIKGNALKRVRTALFLVSIDAANLAPIDTQRLRDNVYREIIMLGPYKFYGAFTFRQDYAEIQHENTDFNHPKGGQSKYAFKALRRNRQKVYRIWAKGIIS